jgi:predicted MPP superfamily phosphohydrolase
MDRRDFLKYHLKGALYLAAGTCGLLRPGASPAQENSVLAGNASSRNRIVFISDLHMNVGASYSWLVKHTGELAEFLKNLSFRDDVAELVILGDMLDDWVCPAAEDAQHVPRNPIRPDQR